MSKKMLAKALLDLGVGETSQDEARKQTQRILSRDRRWVRALIVVTSLLWLASAGTLYWFLSDLVGTYAEMQKASGPEADPLIGSIYKFLIALAGTVEGLMFALLSTFVLMHFSRRATLRQINANLIVLSQQLEERGREQ
jgi:hypothetical protein